MGSVKRDDQDWFCSAFYEVTFADSATISGLVSALFERADTEISAFTLLRNGKDVSSTIDELPGYLDSVAGGDAGFNACDGKKISAPKTFSVGYFRYAELGIDVFRICFLKQDLMQKLRALLVSALDVLKCDYGLGLIKPWVMRPDFFLSGFPLGHEPPEQLRLGKLIWRERYKFDPVLKRPLRRYADGYILGCFEVNVFSSVHFDRLVDGRTLRAILEGRGVEVIETRGNYLVLLDETNIEALGLLLQSMTASI